MNNGAWFKKMSGWRSINSKEDDHKRAKRKIHYSM
jgi:hypothetical protein